MPTMTAFTDILGLPFNRRVGIAHDGLPEVIDAVECVAQCLGLMYLAISSSCSFCKSGHIARHHGRQSFPNQLLVGQSA